MVRTSNSLPIPTSSQINTGVWQVLIQSGCSTAFPRVLLRPITVVNIPIVLHDSECLSTLKWEVEFNPAVYPIMKCLRVLIAAFERQIKAIDWHLN